MCVSSSIVNRKSKIDTTGDNPLPSCQKRFFGSSEVYPDPLANPLGAWSWDWGSHPHTHTHTGPPAPTRRARARHLFPFGERGVAETAGAGPSGKSIHRYTQTSRKEDLLHTLVLSPGPYHHTSPFTSVPQSTILEHRAHHLRLKPIEPKPPKA